MSLFHCRCFEISHDRRSRPRVILGEPGSNLGVDYFFLHEFPINQCEQGKKNIFLLSVRLERGKNCADSWNVSRHLLELQMSFALTARFVRHLPGFAPDGCSLDNWSRDYLHGSVRFFLSFVFSCNLGGSFADSNPQNRTRGFPFFPSQLCKHRSSIEIFV